MAAGVTIGRKVDPVTLHVGTGRTTAAARRDTARVGTR